MRVLLSSHAAFTDAGFRIERFEEISERGYPHVIALRGRR